MTEEKEILIEYFCEICKEKHIHPILTPSKPQNRNKPFPIVHTHRNTKSNEEIISILYLDRIHQNYRIINSISKYKTDITKHPLLNEIIKLESEFKRLNAKYRVGISELRNSIKVLKKTD